MLVQLISENYFKMSIIIGIAVIIFLYWSLVPAKPNHSTFDETIYKVQKEKGIYSNVYEEKLMGGIIFYYEAKEPLKSADKKVFTGTKHQ